MSGMGNMPWARMCRGPKAHRYQFGYRTQNVNELS